MKLATYIKLLIPEQFTVKVQKPLLVINRSLFVNGLVCINLLYISMQETNPKVQGYCHTESLMVVRVKCIQHLAQFAHHYYLSHLSLTFRY